MSGKQTHQEMVLTHLDDQLVAALRTHLPDIRRIANQGPRCGDDKIVQMACCYVAARLLSGRDGQDG